MTDLMRSFAEKYTDAESLDQPVWIDGDEEISLDYLLAKHLDPEEEGREE